GPPASAREPPRQPDGRRSTTRALPSSHARADQGPPTVRATDHSGGQAIHATRHPSHRARAAATTPARRRRPAGRATARSSSDVGGPPKGPPTPPPSLLARLKPCPSPQRPAIALREEGLASFFRHVGPDTLPDPP